MAYGIDYSKVGINSYKEKLKTCHLTKSRLMLRESEGPFKVLESMGFETVADIQRALRNKKLLEAFSIESGIDLTYMTILIREIKSTVPKPEKIDDFKGLSEDLKRTLKALGLKNTKDLYGKIQTKEMQEQFLSEASISENDLSFLISMTDLARVRWVNHTFCEMLMKLGYESLKDLKEAAPEKLHKEINFINEKEGIYRGKIGYNDMVLCIDAAKDVPDDMEHRK